MHQVQCAGTYIQRKIPGCSSNHPGSWEFVDGFSDVREWGGSVFELR